MEERSNIPEYFGSMVFDETMMKQRLSFEVFTQWKKCVEEGKSLDLSTANEIALAMRDWAMERGATHYTHWFQPMTGVTAEKHDSFLSPDEHRHAVMEFSGKELVRGESDASSFPSGGLRATFEARGYTAWDPTSFAFVKDGSLYIPTIFCSYSGQVLDKKTPLLRSLAAVNRQALRLLRLFGDMESKRVMAQIGAEQEFFLLDKKAFEQRDDLRLCGRTLFGARSPKSQELDDHYYGAMKPRVAQYFAELDHELWKLGVWSKTKHNEVAPAQHEIAPIYSDANTACDQNQLTMDLMKKVADRMGMVCLLHEKPFQFVNGSGKHVNWSLGTDTGKNLLSPGNTPSQNAQFLLFLTALISAVHEYQDMLRACVAFSGNDHRLGGNEAPPAILSIFLGDELDEIIASIVSGAEYVEKGKRRLQIGVDSLPVIPQDNTDRNRTSPMAFTGNKFEFRMPGSSQSISGPIVVLNSIMAEKLSRYADELEQEANFAEALPQLIRRELAAHQAIIFNGNGYDKAWAEEAARRGLVVDRNNTASALQAYVDEKNVAMFTKHGVFTREELTARYGIHIENYCKVLHIEAETMLEMIRRQLYPAASAYITRLCDAAWKKEQVLGAVASERKWAQELNAQCDAMLASAALLEEHLTTIPHGDEEELRYFSEVIVPDMAKVREAADYLERNSAEESWPYPTYKDLLFSV